MFGGLGWDLISDYSQLPDLERYLEPVLERADCLAHQQANA